MDVGIRSLSDAELLALVLRHGIPGKNVIIYAQELLSEHGGLRGLMNLEYQQLERIKGLGQARISTLLAINEIAKRQLREEIIGKNYVQDPESVMNYLYLSLRDKKREVVKIIFLNKANRIIKDYDIFQGTVDESVIHPREILRMALDVSATGLVVVHNHPSGRVQPSLADRSITRKIQQACLMFNVSLLDHLIIGDNQYFSFAVEGLL